MATKHEISAELRTDEGKGASRRLRRSGKVPAVVYGAQQSPVSIQLGHNDTLLASRHEWFYSAILDLTVGGSTQKVLLRDMQRHPFKPQLLHLDFQRVNENEAIRIRVPLHFLNQEKSNAGKTSGVLIMHELNEVEVSCLPGNLPEHIVVDLADLKIGDVLHLSNIHLPAGVEIPALKLGPDHDVAVVVARHSRHAEESDAAPVAPAAEVPATKAKAPEKK